jgi:molybdopterin synthase sulfur carrier subunit
VANVVLPALFRPLAGGVATVQAAGATLRDLIADLERQFPALKGRIMDENGMRPEVFIAVNGQESSALGDAIPENAEVHILPAIAGG